MIDFASVLWKSVSSYDLAAMLICQAAYKFSVEQQFDIVLVGHSYLVVVLFDFYMLYISCSLFSVQCHSSCHDTAKQ